MTIEDFLDIAAYAIEDKETMATYRKHYAKYHDEHFVRRMVLIALISRNSEIVYLRKTVIMQRKIIEKLRQTDIGLSLNNAHYEQPGEM